MVLEKDFFVCLVLVIMLHFVLMLFSQLSFRNIKYFEISIARFLILELGHEVSVNYPTLPAKINQSSLETLTWLKFTDSFSSGDFFFLPQTRLYFFYFIFKLYKIVLVLPNIKMNPPQVYMCSPS